MKYQLYTLQGEERYYDTWHSTPVSQKFVPLSTPQDTLEDAKALANNYMKSQYPPTTDVVMFWTVQEFGKDTHQWVCKPAVVNTSSYGAAVLTAFAILPADEIVGEQEHGV